MSPPLLCLDTTNPTSLNTTPAAYQQKPGSSPASPPPFPNRCSRSAAPRFHCSRSASRPTDLQPLTHRKNSRLRSSRLGCRRLRNTGSRLPGCAGAYASAYAAGAATPPAGSADGPPPALAAPNSSAQGQPAAPQPSAAPAVMTLEQAAGYLQVSPADIQALIDDGSLQARRIGSQYRIARQAIDDFLAG